MHDLTNNQEIKQLKRRLNLVIVLFVLILISGLFSFFGLTPAKVVSALGNYSKVTGDQLTLNDWNNLPNDFLKITGSETKNGKLQLNGGVDSGELQLKTDKNNGNWWAIYSHGGYGDLNFWYGNQSQGDNRVTINKDTGNVGIGVGTPGARLEVNGNIKANDPIENDDVVTKNYFNKMRVASGQNISALSPSANAFIGYAGRNVKLPYKEIDLSASNFDCNKEIYIILSQNYVAGAGAPFQAIDAAQCKYIKNSVEKCKFLVECGGSIVGSDSWFASTFDWLAIQLP